MRNVILFLVLFVGVAVGATGCTGCGQNYSEGERSGVILKVSKKGVVFKSWEGELNLGGSTVGEGGIVVPNIWRFSVTNQLIADGVQEAARSGKRVTLQYKEWWAKPSSLDTPYVVTGVLYADKPVEAPK